MLLKGDILLEQIIKALQHYLYQVLGVKSNVHPWKGNCDFPLFLAKSYEFYEITLFEHSCLLMIAKEGEALTPATIKKQWKFVKEKYSGFCIFVQKSSTPHNRQRLIKHDVPFIIPGNQMYLPRLGIDLREYYPQSKIRKKILSPSTQSILIYALYHAPSDGFTASALIQKFGYSRMTIMRAFNELEAASIGTVYRKGKERYWSFKESKQKIWNKAKPLLSNPIKQRIWVKGVKPSIRSGLTALAERSLLCAPAIPIYACSLSDWKKWKESGAEVVPIPEGAIAELQIWHYDPKLVADTDIVDPFSLYLSLQKDEDERIEAALEEMLENIKW